MVREGEQVIELPMIQALFRAMGVAAIKGNRFAQETLAKLVNQIEAADREERTEYMKTMIETKVSGEQALERARNLGQREPELVPHPDDIIIDFYTPDVHVNGPKTKQEKEVWDQLWRQREQLQESISSLAREEGNATAKRKKALRKTRLSLQRTFDEINDNAPRRYRVHLANRCWEDGASLPGSQRTLTWPGETNIEAD